MHQSHIPHVHVKNISIEERRSQPQPFCSYSPRSPRTPRTPRTPHKNYFCSYKGDSHTFEYDSTQKYRYKGQPKNITSPAMNRKSQSITPQDSSQSSSYSSRSDCTPSAAAYAGPTFHSSPAPSALPIPRFYTKSIPDSPSLKLINDHAKDSQLRILIKPEKEEKENSKTISPATELSSESILHLISPLYTGNAPKNRTYNDLGKNNHARPPASAMLSIELGDENDSNTSYGPPFSTPFSERISAMKSDEIFRSNSPQHTSKKYSHTANAEALKAYLFSGHLSSTVPSDFTGTRVCN